MGEKFLSTASLVLGIAGLVLVLVPVDIPLWIPTGISLWGASTAFIAGPRHSFWVKVARWGLFFGILGAFAGLLEYGTVYFLSLLD